MSRAQFLVGDVFARTADIPDGSVDLIVTSPPFLALRSYLPADHPDKHKEIGSESTPAAFLTTLLALTCEWRRILAPHGSLCVELGDTYAGSGGAGGDYNEDGLRDGQNKWRKLDWKKSGLIDKSLAGIPEAYQLSLSYGWNMLNPAEKCDRWRVRNRIVWHRPNPPVGALGDKVRPSTSYITVACTSRTRWFDLDAERTPHTGHSASFSRSNAKHRNLPNDDGWSRLGDYDESQSAGAPPLDCWFDDNVPATPPSNTNTHRRTAKGVDSVERTGKSSARGGNWASLKELAETAGAPPLDCWIDTTEPDVWTIPTSPYPGAHYATFPPALPRRLINLMCPRQVCLVCGEPRRRIVEADRQTNGKRNKMDSARIGGSRMNTMAETTYSTLGWSDCRHNTWRRGLVLDPFAGSGTTLQAASELGRDSIGIDLDPRNLDLARQRVGMFLEEEEPVA